MKMRRHFWLLRVTAALVIPIVAAGCAAVGSQPQAVAVWDLEDLNSSQPGPAEMGQLLAGQVMARLDADGRYQVLERQQLLKVLEELQLGSSELADAQTRLRLGRIVGARQMIFGAFQRVGPLARVDLRLVDVASGKIVRTAAAAASSMDLNGWFQAADKAAAELLK